MLLGMKRVVAIEVYSDVTILRPRHCHMVPFSFFERKVGLEELLFDVELETAGLEETHLVHVLASGIRENTTLVRHKVAANKHRDCYAACWPHRHRLVDHKAVRAGGQDERRGLRGSVFLRRRRAPRSRIQRLESSRLRAQ